MRTKTRGEQGRVVLRAAQNWIARAKSNDPYLIPPTNEEWWRAYYMALGTTALEEWKALFESIDPDEPVFGLYALVPCSHTGCSRSVSVESWWLWTAKKQGRTHQAFCPEHTPDPSPPSKVEMIEPQDRPEWHLSELVRLDRAIFELDPYHPTMAARMQLGVWERDVAWWQRVTTNLQLELGDEADARIAKARADAGTDIYFREDYQPTPGPPFVERRPERSAEKFAPASAVGGEPPGDPPPPTDEDVPDEDEPEKEPEDLGDFIF